MMIRAVLMDDFYFGDDAVLVSMDGPGVAAFAAALRAAQPKAPSRFEHDGMIHECVITSGGGSSVDIADTSVTWRLDPEIRADMITKLHALHDSTGPGHHYVDICSPAETLVLSRDEYPAAWLNQWAPEVTR